MANRTAVMHESFLYQSDACRQYESIRQQNRLLVPEEKQTTNPSVHGGGAHGGGGHGGASDHGGGVRASGRGGGANVHGGDARASGHDGDDRADVYEKAPAVELMSQARNLQHPSCLQK